LENRCIKLIDKVIKGKYTLEEWKVLQREYDDIVSTASAEEVDVLEESGIGEMLYMICSG